MKFIDIYLMELIDVYLRCILPYISLGAPRHSTSRPAYTRLARALERALLDNGSNLVEAQLLRRREEIGARVVQELAADEDPHEVALAEDEPRDDHEEARFGESNLEAGEVELRRPESVQNE